MIEVSRLPKVLRSIVYSEEIDFAVKAGRAQPLKKSLYLIFFGFIWSAFTSIFVITFFGPIFLGREVHFESFVIVGIVMILWGVFSAMKKGGYFVGTPLRLVHFRKGNIRSIDWEQFSGDILLTGNEKKGNISLQLRTGQMVNNKNSSNRYVPDVIYISEIPHALEVVEICRKRIKENDPTPPSV